MASCKDVGDDDALIVVDVQIDFLPGGALAVPDGDAVIEPLNRCIDLFVRSGRPVMFTRDWHPANHCSFQAQGGPWPPHCVVGTRGARFAPALRVIDSARIISKATQPEQEAYSGFQTTDMARVLHASGARRVFIGGLATDYCVLATALDARASGLEVEVLTDAVRAVNLRPGDGDQALRRMCASGVGLTESSALRVREA